MKHKNSKRPANRNKAKALVPKTPKILYPIKHTSATPVPPENVQTEPSDARPLPPVNPVDAQSVDQPRPAGQQSEPKPEPKQKPKAQRSLITMLSNAFWGTACSEA